MATVRPLPNPGRSRPLQPINLRDFRGGLVSRNGDMMDVLPNELRDAQNIIVQETGGIASRGGFVKTAAFPPVSAASGYRIQAAEAPDGSLHYVYQYGTTMHYGTTTSDGTLTTTTAAVTTRWDQIESIGSNGFVFMAPAATSTAASFITRWSTGVYKNFTTLMSLPGATWQDNFSTPSGSYMPGARYLAVHQNMMFAACNYLSSGAEGFNRLRWSHPGDPGSWRQIDYIDMPASIAGIRSIGNQLVIWTEGAVYALRGYSAETFAIQKISDAGMGAYTQAFNHCVSPDGRAFWYQPEGVWQYDGQQVTRLSTPVEPLMTQGRTLCESQMIFTTGPRPMLIVPARYDQTFVYLDDINAWVKWSMPWTGSPKVSYVPWAQGQSVASPRLYAIVSWGFTGSGDFLMKYDPTAAYDLPSATQLNIPATFTTSWVDARQPAIKKTWKRPEFVYRASVAGDFTVVSYVDYNDTADKTMTLSNAGSAANYEVDKLTSIGPARSVSLKVTAPTATNVNWSLEDIVLKYRAKPLRN